MAKLEIPNTGSMTVKAPKPTASAFCPAPGLPGAGRSILHGPCARGRGGKPGPKPAGAQTGTQPQGGGKETQWKRWKTA